jgi:hypothetical protein
MVPYFSNHDQTETFLIQVNKTKNLQYFLHFNRVKILIQPIKRIQHKLRHIFHIVQ